MRLALLLWLLAPSAFGALSAATVWEVRAAGTSTAGGGFVAGASGTDRSQQNAVQTTFTDLAITATTTDVTSAAFPFGATDVGNIINITGGAGFTTGRYQVVSVASVTATLDRAAGTALSVGGAAVLGGAISVFAQVEPVAIAGNTLWIMSGTYTEVLAMTISPAASVGRSFIGYSSTRGDAPLGTGRPLIDASGIANGITVGTTQGNTFAYIRESNATGDGVIASAGSRSRFEYCKFSDNAGDGVDSAGLTFLIGCEVSGNALIGVKNSSTIGLLGCNIRDNIGAGVVASSISVSIGNVFDTNGGHGFDGTTSTSTYLFGNTAYGNTGASSSGFLINDRTENTVINNIAKDNGQYGFTMSASGTAPLSGYFNFNAYHGNATAGLNNITAGPNDSTADPGFIDAANGNFAIGAALRRLGFPAVFPGGLSRGYPDIGAVQRQDGGVSRSRVVNGGGL